MEMNPINSKTPVSMGYFGTVDFTSNKVSLVYEKYSLKPPFEIEKDIRFCCLIDSKLIAASSLTKKDLKNVEIKHADTYPKAPGVNCYSFATGRSPLVSGDDPVPGGDSLENIRKAIIKKEKLAPKFKETAKDLLGKLDENQLMEVLATESKEFSSPLNKFTQAFFGKPFEDLEQTEITLLMDFLTKGYQVPENTPYLSREVTDRLLQLDGLIKIYPECDKRDLSDCEFGRVFLAAFVNPKSDYHFMRYFKDGWYERVGDQIRKRPNMQAEIPFPKNDKEILLGFKSLENENDLEDFQFVGYYVVPTTVVLADKIGRKYILEHHKV
jgi:hypothetical protein